MHIALDVSMYHKTGNKFLNFRETPQSFPAAQSECKIMLFVCRNPEPRLRPTFDKVFRSLRAPQDELLYWTPEDVAGGRHLLRSSSSSSHSFSDLQNKYITPQTGRH